METHSYELWQEKETWKRNGEGKTPNSLELIEILSNTGFTVKYIAYGSGLECFGRWIYPIIIKAKNQKEWDFKVNDDHFHTIENAMKASNGEQTVLDIVIEKFPKTLLNKYGIPKHICPSYLGLYSSGNLQGECDEESIEECIKCWNMMLKDI